ncbi:MAG TPA: sulfotransferase [Bryobacteraceae bacterium]|nr:sulfotransferase [Bryobacteraceae bacterium]
MKGPCLPSFFIAGAPKSGTTSLYHYLDQHPEIYMSRVKEPHYFASEIRRERFSKRLQPQAEQQARALREYLEGPMHESRFSGPVTEWSDYLKLFQHAKGQKAIGEASVCYLWAESAPGNIRASIPDARIILVLRNPVEMIFSMFLQTLRSGSIQCTFREAIHMGLAQRGGEIDLFHPFLDLGLYHGQVKRMLDTFPEGQVRVYWYEDFQAEPLRMLADIFRFVGVDPMFRPDMSKRFLESQRPGLPLEEEDRSYLTEFYREDIEKLGDLLGRDLSNWLGCPDRHSRAPQL